MSDEKVLDNQIISKGKPKTIDVISEMVEFGNRYFFGMNPKQQRSHIKYLESIFRKQLVDREKAKFKERLKKL